MLVKVEDGKYINPTKIVSVTRGYTGVNYTIRIHLESGKTIDLKDQDIEKLLDSLELSYRDPQARKAIEYVCPNCFGHNGLHSGMDECPPDPDYLHGK